jgi:hypothetical protein
MTYREIIKKVKAQNWPKDSYVVYGSCPLALANIREAGDIDLLVSHDLYVQLKDQGWKQIVKGPKDQPLTFDVFEAHENWDFSDYSPSLEHLLASADIVQGVPFASLSEVRKWKAASPGNLKFQADVKLIDQYLAQQV